jgi:hypothetical protein
MEGVENETKKVIWLSIVPCTDWQLELSLQFAWIWEYSSEKKIKISACVSINLFCS